MTTHFFAPRERRAVLGFVLTDFPFPLAVTYSRLQQFMDRDEPVEAALQLRDALETLLKFTAGVAVADCLGTALLPEAREKIVGLLFKPLSLGDWKALLLEHGLKPLASLARAGRFADSGRLVPELYGVFYHPRSGSFSPAAAKLFQSKDVVNWRNKEWGHGCFRRDRGWYAATVLEWLPVLEEVYAALQGALTGWKLATVLPEGERIDWSGDLNLPPIVPHQHQRPEGRPLPMHLVHADGRSLDLTPLLTMQTCQVAECGQPAAFFCEGNEFDRKRDRYKTYFLEYMEGHKNQHGDWAEARRLAGYLPARFDWERSGYDWQAVRAQVEELFRGFSDDYRRPGYLLDAVWQFTEEQGHGYIHVVGVAGVGKTYLVRGLEQEGRQKGVPVLAYHIRAGALSDYRTFLSELSDLAKENLHWRTQEVQTAGISGIAGLQAQFVAFVGKLMALNAPGTLLIVLDGLDELHELARATDAWISDFLPAASELPDRCFIVLTRREAVQPQVGKWLVVLQRNAGEKWLELQIRPEEETNRTVLRSYLRERLPEALRGPTAVEAVVERSGGVFLYAFHLCQALSNGVFADPESLPAGEQFYPAYLERLRRQVGDELYEQVYLRTLLLLAAARQAVTLGQLESWGVPAERLRFALLDLGDFLRLHRGRRWHDSLADDGEDRYEIAHAEFLRYARTDGELSRRYRQAHAIIGRKALAASNRRWDQIDVEDEAAVYDLRFVLPHLEEGGLEIEASVMRRDENYANACLRVGNQAFQLGRFHFAVDLHERALTVFRELVQAARGMVELLDQPFLVMHLLFHEMLFPGFCHREEQRAADSRAPLFENIAQSLVKLGMALAGLGRLEEAVSSYDEAIDIRRRLVRGGRAVLASDLARAIGNRGVALCGLGRLDEAVSSCDEAITILRQAVRFTWLGVLSRCWRWLLGLWRGRNDDHRRRQLVGAGRAELANYLARAIGNRGVALDRLGRWEEAVSACDEAIAILRRLVGAGRAELANDLARALMNRGVALDGLGRLDEAVSSCDEAITILRPLVGASRADLANDLANAIVNRGVVLDRLGRWEEAVSSCDEAVAILRQLVGAGRAELANDLAKALLTKALVLERMQDCESALECYREAIAWQEACARAGMTHLLFVLLQMIRYRLTTFLDLSRWEEAAEDVLSFHRRALFVLRATTVPAAVRQEVYAFGSRLRKLAPEDRVHLDAALGDNAATVRQFLGF